MGHGAEPGGREDCPGEANRVSYLSVFGHAAEADYERALDWYLAHAPHQAALFEAHVALAITRITEFPSLAPVSFGGLRRIHTEVFPYSLWYRVHDQAALIQILAVLHDRRDPSIVSTRS